MLIQCQPKFKMTKEFDCSYRFVSEQNKRTGQFNTDVFHSIPEFLRSITSLIDSKQFTDYKVALQERIYIYISLYTVKSITYSQFKKVIIASRTYLKITCFQQIVLTFLFYGKKYFNITKGKTLYFKTLKKLYT